MDVEEGCYDKATKSLGLLNKMDDHQLREFSADSECVLESEQERDNLVRPVDRQEDVKTGGTFDDQEEHCWTNDKHVSYLNSMEQDFIRSLYERSYCAVDICGQEPLRNGCQVVAESILSSSETSHKKLDKAPAAKSVDEVRTNRISELLDNDDNKTC